MNRDEGPHYLSHVYGPFLATVEPSADQSSRSRREKMDQYQSSLSRWPLTKMAETIRLVKLNGFDKMNIDSIDFHKPNEFL